jgi:hypothetical protein
MLLDLESQDEIISQFMRGSSQGRKIKWHFPIKWRCRLMSLLWVITILCSLTLMNDLQHQGWLPGICFWHWIVRKLLLHHWY